MPFLSVCGSLLPAHMSALIVNLLIYSQSSCAERSRNPSIPPACGDNDLRSRHADSWPVSTLRFYVWNGVRLEHHGLAEHPFARPCPSSWSWLKSAGYVTSTLEKTKFTIAHMVDRLGSTTFSSISRRHSEKYRAE